MIGTQGSEGLTDHELLLRILDAQERMGEQLDGLASEHGALRAYVYGNGSVGLGEQVRIIREKMSTASKIAWSIGIPFTLAVLGALWALLSHRAEVIVK